MPFKVLLRDQTVPQTVPDALLEASVLFKNMRDDLGDADVDDSAMQLQDITPDTFATMAEWCAANPCTDDGKRARRASEDGDPILDALPCSVLLGGVLSAANKLDIPSLTRAAGECIGKRLQGKSISEAYAELTGNAPMPSEEALAETYRRYPHAVAGAGRFGTMSLQMHAAKRAYVAMKTAADALPEGVEKEAAKEEASAFAASLFDFEEDEDYKNTQLKEFFSSTE